MDAAELIAWLAAQQDELEDFCRSAQNWRTRRIRRGIQTRSDARYDLFLDKAADLIAGLQAWRGALEAEMEAEGAASSPRDSGGLVE